MKRKTHTSYSRMQAHWALPDTLLGGTLAMRAASRTYLPQEAAEAEAQYSARLGRSVLYNCYSDTLDKLVGKPFSKSIIANIPAELETLKLDVDGTGKSLHDFAKDCFKEAVHRGLSHILIDYSQVPEGLSKAEEAEIKARPFLLHISPTNIIDWDVALINHVPTLNEIAIVEIGPDDTEYIRVIGRGYWSLHKKQETASKEEVYIKVSEGLLSLNYVPLVTCYFNGDGFMSATPCLEDLAWMNLAHWQSYSDQRNILRFARTGLLFVKGLTDAELDTPITVGPNQTFRASSENADMRFVELGTGGALKAGADDVADIERKMDRFGMRPLTAKTGGETATGKAIDEKNENTDIHCWIRALERALEKALGVAADWKSLSDSKEDINVDIYNEFALSLKSDTDLKTLDTARSRKDISQRTFLEELKRRAVVSEHLDLDVEIAATASESELTYGF